MPRAKEVKAFTFPRVLTERTFHYCPGCHHGIAHRLLAEVIEELGVRERAYGVASIGCACFLYHYFDVDICEAPHGRACAAATGAKRARPELVVFTYQGDGDFAAIGLTESLHAAARGERITAIMINNTVYGMTGGQLSPTTLPGQRTTTTPEGRDPRIYGYPLKVAEILAAFPGVAFCARVAVNRPKRVLEAREALRKAFLAQIEDRGFGYVEFLSACPVNWKLDPVRAAEKVDELAETFPLGVFRDLS
ncbi:thiamine pyrophosphate-dependent enzyme [Thermosulfurimonas sp. F29]|uniref:thiamine pyrophosphate-dependent enzyme n=1 Tax=Thermosulfurimonas sp. F29 TaxID=2867247 RepID=UPI001C83E012|nr:thiamine pyrophosphate-dependent enzyme [Thermosulfurimonas sp. F29]MBX6422583.1 2-oxoglutarate oxidoreductase [Thermosulfurimonas sp. F29]